jgi:hypothetical protein
MSGCLDTGMSFFVVIHVKRPYTFKACYLIRELHRSFCHRHLSFSVSVALEGCRIAWTRS